VLVQQWQVVAIGSFIPIDIHTRAETSLHAGRSQ